MAEQDESQDELFALLYKELRRRAAAERRKLPSPTLNTTAVVHEAYERLSQTAHAFTSREHFLAVASVAMRRLLIDAARQRTALRRGGGDADLPLDEALGLTMGRAEQLLDLDEALERLAAVDPRQAKVIECRFFAGFTRKETAEALGLSETQIGREVRLATGWLAMQLGDGDTPDPRRKP